MKWSEMGISLKYDFVASFLLYSSEPDLPNLGPTWPVYWYEGATICPSDSIPIAQTLCMWLNVCMKWSKVGISLKHDVR